MMVEFVSFNLPNVVCKLDVTKSDLMVVKWLRHWGSVARNNRSICANVVDIFGNGILSELAIAQWILKPALQFIDWSGNDGRRNQPPTEKQ